MVEALAVEVDLHAGLYCLEHVGAARPFHELRVALARNHYADVHPGEGGDAHGRHDGFGWQEIGGLDIHVVFRFEQYAHVALHDVGPGAYGTARHYLRDDVVLDVAAQFGVIAAVGYQLARHEIPVHEKRPLYGVDRAAAEFQVRVAPLAPTVARHVPLGDVHAADEPLAAVHHAELAVVAVVHLAREGREPHRHEGHHRYAGVAHTGEERVLHVPAAHVVVYEPHLHALPGLVD